MLKFGRVKLSTLVLTVLGWNIPIPDDFGFHSSFNFSSWIPGFTPLRQSSAAFFLLENLTLTFDIEFWKARLFPHTIHGIYTYTYKSTSTFTKPTTRDNLIWNQQKIPQFHGNPPEIRPKLPPFLVQDASQGFLDRLLIINLGQCRWKLEHNSLEVWFRSSSFLFMADL